MIQRLWSKQWRKSRKESGLDCLCWISRGFLPRRAQIILEPHLEDNYFTVWGVGFGAWGLKFGVWGLRFGGWDSGFWVWVLVFGVWGLGFGGYGFEFALTDVACS
jgi:hypothetical protein